MTINRRKFLLTSASGVLLGYFGIIKEAVAQKLKYKTSEYQGFNFEAGTKEKVGYITALKIGDKEYPADIKVLNPLDLEGSKLSVVGVVTNIIWYGPADAIEFIARVPPRSRKLAGMQAYRLAGSTSPSPPIEFEFVVFDYDDEAKKHYKSFHSGSNTLQGVIDKRRGDFEFDLDPTPSEVVAFPRNFELYLSIMPDEKAQDLHVATAHDSSAVKTWGPR